jgi:uncharacterized protein (UPF0332 family)
LLAGGHFDFAAARTYYAAFYAASALLLSRGRDRTKHSGVLAAINKDFVRTGALETEAGRALGWLFELRGIGDYGETSHVPPEDAREALAAARRFVDCCGALLRDQGIALPESRP